MFVRKLFKCNPHINLRAPKFDFGLHTIQYRHFELRIKSWFTECSYPVKSVYSSITQLLIQNGIHKNQDLLKKYIKSSNSTPNYSDPDIMRSEITNNRINKQQWYKLVEEKMALIKNDFISHDIGKHESLHQIKVQIDLNKSDNATNNQQQTKLIPQPYLLSNQIDYMHARFMMFARADSIPIRSTLWRWTRFEDDHYSLTCPMCRHHHEDIQHFISDCPAYNVYREYAKISLFIELNKLLHSIILEESNDSIINIYSDSFISNWNSNCSDAFRKLILGITQFNSDNIFNAQNKLIGFKSKHRSLISNIFIKITSTMIRSMFYYRSLICGGISNIKFIKKRISRTESRYVPDEVLNPLSPNEFRDQILPDYERRKAMNLKWSNNNFNLDFIHSKLN
jgi:hypothetical protein